jgi:alpha-beta hydrolase superfamily lysophospholipase
VRVPSTDHVSVATHDFGGRGRPLLLSHATGFHGYCYLPIADELAGTFHGYALDYRGHGATARPADWDVEWNGYGDDATAVVEAIAPDGELVAFGHSMGGATLLMAALRRPELFDLIVAFEPIVFPPDWSPPVTPPSFDIVEGARRRRASFPSFEAAIEHYGSKPPLAAFDPDVLRLYVAHGFRPAPEGVRLNCDPEHEARTFEASRDHETWDRLGERLPNAELVELADTTSHFWPFVDPGAVAALIARHAG